jgi:MFS family permease
MTEEDRAAAHRRRMALSSTTLGVLAAFINSSIILISLPAIFRGIHLNPLDPSNTGVLLWTIMGYMVATSVFVVTFGRLGDMYGRTRIYNFGFALFTAAALALALMPTGKNAALYLVWMRIVQGVGGAMITATATAILVDVFRPEQRGFAIGVNTVAAIAGQFIGLLIGGLLADINWRLVFWINVPIGAVGTIWGFVSLRDRTPTRGGRVDWWGSASFAVGLVLVLTAITDGIQPAANALMAWTTPKVLAELVGGLLVLCLFVLIEKRVERPMFDVALLRIRPFSMANLASLLASTARGGLQFMLIIWLQGVWLPLHGYSFAATPLWAGIFMLPLTAGFLAAGLVSGWLSDRYGARAFTTGGMILGAAAFLGLMLLHADFDYRAFATLIFASGVASGLFSAPNSTQIMNAAPAKERGQASGVRATMLNTGQVLSIGIFFSLMIAGLAWKLPEALEARLVSQGLSQAVAAQAAHAPPVASLFAAFLGYNPMAQLVPASALHALPAAQATAITGKHFFPEILAAPFTVGIKVAFSFALLLYLLAAAASWKAGAKYVNQEGSGQVLRHAA